MKQRQLPGFLPQRVRFTGHSPVSEVVSYYEQKRGRRVYGRDVLRKHASDMLDAGYTVDEIKSCIDRANRELPTEYEWTLAYVARKIPEYARRRREESAKRDVGVIQRPSDWSR